MEKAGEEKRDERRPEEDGPGVHRTFIQLTDSSRVTGGQEIVLIPIHTPTSRHYTYAPFRVPPRSSDRTDTGKLHYVYT